VPLDRLAEYEGEPASRAAEGVGLRLDSETHVFLNRIQEKQDNGHDWGDALDDTLAERVD